MLKKLIIGFTPKRKSIVLLQHFYSCKYLCEKSSNKKETITLHKMIVYLGNAKTT